MNKQVDLPQLKCGSDSVELNAIVNAKVKFTFLEFGVDKCFNLHIGKKNQWNKGMGIVSSVTSLLNHVSLGFHYFKMGLLLQETNVINGIMTCTEVLHGITKEQVKKLENVDEVYKKDI